MRRTHLRGHHNILKRQLIHIGAFNLSLIFRSLLGAGTPRELRNRLSSFIFALSWLLKRSPMCTGSINLYSSPPRLHPSRSEEHTSELQSRLHLVCRLLLEKKKQRDMLDPRSIG